MSDWRKLVAEYSVVCLNNGFAAAAFRLRESDLSLAEAISIIKEMCTFIAGYEYAARQSIDGENLMRRIDTLDEETSKVQRALEFRKEQNKKVFE